MNEGSLSQYACCLSQTASVYEHCVCVRIDGARGLPPACEIFCEVQAGSRIRHMPLLLSQADLEAGGGGRIDGGHISERVDLLSDARPASLEVRVLLKAHGAFWTTKSQKFVGRCTLAGRWVDALHAAAAPSRWVSLHVAAPDGSGDTTREATRRASFAGARGPALLLRVQCFERVDLEDSAARQSLFERYSADGETLSATEFEHVMLDVAAGRRGARGAEDDARAITKPRAKGGACALSPRPLVARACICLPIAAAKCVASACTGCCC